MQVASTATVGFSRSLLLAFCVWCLAINAVSLFSGSVEASSALGFQVARTSDPALVRIVSVDSGGAAEASGLRAGDLIQLRNLSPGDRYRLLTGVYPHERIPIVISRGQQVIRLTYQSGDKPIWRWDVWIWCIASFWMLGFAFLIAWRRPDSAEARILCVLLALNPAGAGLMAGAWIGPSPFVDLLTACAGYLITWISAALLATYAVLFGRPLSRARRVMTWLAYAAAAALALYEIVRLALLWTGAVPWVAQTLAPDWNFGWGAIPYVLALACAWAAAAAAQGQERSRIVWTTATIGLLYLAQSMMFFAPMIFHNSGQGSALPIAYAFVNVGAFLAPLGMTYALLNRRLLDIGFALNRVAIFSAVSIIIVGLFVLAEWALSAWLERASHTANLLADAAVAVALGFSIRFVHARVEHVLDRIFFRKRHEDEQAIRRFSREAAYITDAGTLCARTVATLERHADASSVVLALDDGLGSYGAVSENDPAILSLRTWHRVVDLHRIATRFQGEYAYPMVARGRLVGALVIGPKRSQESYAPDESQAIEELAQGVGGALDILLQAGTARDDRIVAELEAMRSGIAEGFRTINARLGRGDEITENL
ncbi:MAG TPA: PDZ domain-containing protein [Candidatus Baltobacteraceae bacterium]|nr:PDZ domain-containing protein [Candidatus Baltobacteraceae bacterium]